MQMDSTFALSDYVSTCIYRYIYNIYIYIYVYVYVYVYIWYIVTIYVYVYSYSIHLCIYIYQVDHKKTQPKFKKENKQNHQRYWNHILYPDSMGHILSIIKLLSFLWIKSFKWYVLGSWTFLTCKKRRQNHSYLFCNFNKFHEVLFHFQHEFFLTQCNAMASYLISPLHCIHNG